MEATASTKSATAEDVRAFTIDIPDEQIEDLRSRIEATRLPKKESVESAAQGVQLATAQELRRYWGRDYDLGRLEERLNAFPQFMTDLLKMGGLVPWVRKRLEERRRKSSATSG